MSEPMLSVEEAVSAVLETARRLPARAEPLGSARGLALDEDVEADRDSPPFDKALVDGYAIRSEDLKEPVERSFAVVSEVMAGDWQERRLGAGDAVSIMTGAAMPPGADAVVMVELARREGTRVHLSGPVSHGQNRLERGREWSRGETILRRGEVLDAVRLGLAAALGRERLRVVARPSVAVVPTGNELVEPGRQPGPGQIRNSNGVLLSALVETLGAEARAEPIERDEKGGLTSRFARLMGSGPEAVDVLLVSGGVSAGKLDLVPSALAEAGAEAVFHKVKVRPGKPLWFGRGPERGDRPRALIFGLPGNPVSGVVSILLFVRPALEVLAGRSGEHHALRKYPLGQEFRHKGDRKTYHPARLEGEPKRLEPRSWAGSPDLRALAGVDGFVVFEPGDRGYEIGDLVGFLPWPGGRP